MLDLSNKAIGEPWKRPDYCPCCDEDMSKYGWENLDQEQKWYCRACGSSFYW